MSLIKKYKQVRVLSLFAKLLGVVLMLSMVSCNYSCEGGASDPEPKSQQEQGQEETPPITPLITLKSPTDEILAQVSFNLIGSVTGEISNTAEYILHAKTVAYSDNNYTTPQRDLTAKTNVDAMNGKTLQEVLKGKPASLAAGSKTTIPITVDKHTKNVGNSKHKRWVGGLSSIFTFTIVRQSSGEVVAGPLEVKWKLN